MGAMSVSVSRPAVGSCSRNMRAASLRHVQKPASVPQKAWSGNRRAKSAARVRSSTETVESEAADKDEVVASVDEGEQEPKKYYRSVPGFPNMMVEYDEPLPEKKPRKPAEPWKVAMLIGGVALMFTEAATFAALTLH